MCTNQDIFNISFIIRGNHFLVHGHKKDLPHITYIFHLLKYVVKYFLVSAFLHHIYLLTLIPKSYFKISTFQPNFLCSSSLKLHANKIQCMDLLAFIHVCVTILSEEIQSTKKDFLMKYGLLTQNTNQEFKWLHFCFL